VPLSQTPSVENKVVLRYLRQRSVEQAPGRGRKNHIIERSTRHDRLDRTAPVKAEQTGK